MTQSLKIKEKHFFFNINGQTIFLANNIIIYVRYHLGDINSQLLMV